jgi:hypothetical protein
VHSYRPPRPGDLLAVRTTDPHIGEQQVPITSVVDSGDHLVLSGAWHGCDLQVVVIRIGDTHSYQLTEI